MKMTTNSLLSQAQSQAQIELQKFAQQPDFLAQLQVAFGDDFDQNIALDIASQFRSGDFSLIPDLRVLTNGELGDANGAYAGDLDEIFVSSDFLAQRQGDLPAIANLLLEEFGHKLDRLLNGNVDSLGDEGAIFAALSQGQTLSTDALAQLRAEDDHRTIVVDGKLVAIEMENWTGTNGPDNHTGADASNLLQGGGGNDTLYGATGNDLLYGDYGDDYLFGLLGDDTLHGGFGDDSFFGGDGNDRIFGEDGNDYLYGEDGNDTLEGGAGNDFLSGGAGDDYLFGDAGNDNINADVGNDNLYGGTGNDRYIYNAAFTTGIDKVDESYGDGIDTLDFSPTFNQGIGVDLSSTTSQTVAPGLQITIIGDIENVYGGGGNDIIYGNSLDNTLTGDAGNDYLSGQTGNDYLSGWTGNDYLSGDAGNDTLVGGAGNDTLSGQTGNDYLFGEDGNDNLYGDAGNDTLYGGTGNDTLYGGTGNDILLGEAGNDSYIFNAAYAGVYIVDETYESGIDTLDFSTTTTQGIGITLNSTTIQTVAPGLQITINGDIENVIGGASNDYLSGNSLDNTLNGGDGNDTLSGWTGNDYLYGGNGNDFLNGDAGNDNLYGDAGDDSLNGDAGDDNLYGGDGNDFLIGGTGDDYLISGNGNDYLVGEDGNDYLSAGNGDDYLIGNAGNDTLYGGFGNDILNGAAGNDTLNGAAGNDTYRFNAAIDTGVDIVDETSASGIDTLDFSNTTTQAISVNLSSTTIQTVSPGLQLTINGDIENAIGGSINDSIVGNSLDNTLSGDAGDDYLTGGAGNDTLFGGTGSDLIYGDAGNDTINGDAGDDFLYDYGGGNDLLVGGDGNDILYGDVGNDTLTGGTGNDTYYLSYYTTDLTNDTVIENPGEGTDVAYAIFSVSALADNVENLTLLGTDNINGNGNGLNNIITGNDGNNILDGGAGNDSLYGGLGDDFLGDYGGGNDLIVGGDGNDGLYGGAGTDTLIGGMGNDSYYLSYVPSDLTNDTITENPGEGIDTAYTIFSVNALAANVENLTLLGSSNINGTGNSLDNQLLGNSGNNTLDGGAGNDFIANFYNTGSNTLIGGDGNDILYGGGANDTLIGGNGDDTYYLSLAPTELATDTITETTTGGMDNAISLSTVGLLANNIENLFLVGSANINGTGNASNNIILGNSGNNTINGGDGNDFVGDYAGGDDALSGGNGNDTLSGGAGSDTLSGGNGDDLYYISSAPTELNDTIIELANGGTDTAVAYATVTQLADNVENLYLSGTANIDGTGNSIDNTILGNSGNNSLFGGAGNDFLGDYAGGNDTFNGGAGNDIIFGGTGIDSFVFSGNSLLSFQTALGVDNIADFTVADDIILLSKGNFGSLGTAAGNSLLSADFATVTTDTATTLGSSIVYNSANGKLFYDANGAAAGFGTGGQFAQLSSGLGLTGNQFKAIV